MLAAPRAMHQYKGIHIAKRTLADLERFVDNPTELMITSNSTIKPPSITGQGLDILSASQYPYTFNERYASGSISESQRKANGTPTQSSQFYGGLVYDDPNASSSGEASSADSRDQTSQIPPPSISASSYPNELANASAADLRSALKRDSKAPQAVRSSEGVAARRKSSNAADEDQSPEPRPRKRAKKNAVASAQDKEELENGKKQRGRPRVDTQDETAADRRRTQIRLAQRAYRNRKETTITGLKGRVSELQSTVEQMNTAFVALYDNLMGSGIVDSKAALFAQLKSVSAEFESCSQAAKVEEDYDELDVIATSTEKKVPSKAAPVKTVKPGTASPEQPTQDSDIELLPTSDANADLMYDYGQMWPDNLSGDVMQFNVHVPEARIALDDVFNVEKTRYKLSPTLERPLPTTTTSPFYTYSFQETTFSRRLHRLALERAFRHLTNPAANPTYVNRAFRFTFCFTNRKRLVARFQDVLRRKAGEALENFNVPFFHIGGAGTHFPRRDAAGNSIFPPNLADPETAIAPALDAAEKAEWSLMETPRSETTTEEMLERLGYGGMWFDSHDVEEYLKTIGIFLDGTSSFVEVDPRKLNFLTTFPGTSAALRPAGNGSNVNLDPFSNTSSSGASSTYDSPQPRTPSPPHGLGPATVEYIPDHWMSTQPPPPTDNFFPSFDPESTQPYLTAIEKDFRAQDPWTQIQTVQARQVWPWTNNPLPATNDDLTAAFLGPFTDDDNALRFSSLGDVVMPLAYGREDSNNSAAAFANAAATAQPPEPPKQEQQRNNSRAPSVASAAAELSANMMNHVLATLQQRGQTVTVDVDKFLSRMVDGGACLGRAPGFRKELVDNAIVLSLQEAF